MIEPAKGTRDFRLEMNFDDINISDIEITEVEERDQFRVYKSEGIWFFINRKTNTLSQLSLFSPFNEKVLGKIGIGDEITKVHEYLGECLINDNVYEPINYPGVAFNTVNNQVKNNAVIEVISVSLPYEFYGELPEHIANNIPGKTRKLP
jgi:hypothetical protein